MFRQRFEEDYPEIIKDSHIEKVSKAIQEGYSQYLEKLLVPPPDPLGLEGLADMGKVVKKATSPKRDPSGLVAKFKEAIAEFEKLSPQYKEFFAEEAMEEHADQPGSFKAELSKRAPIIRQTVNSHQSELVEWHKRFNATKSPALLDMFTNLMDFFREYVDDITPKKLAGFNSREDFPFEAIEDDEECRISGVVGMGIKSTVLHYQEPSLFSCRDRYSLLGFYLLSDCEHFGVPTKSSEFVMFDPEQQLDDGTIYSAHNFWYPYALFTLYSLRLYRWLKKDLAELDVDLDDHYRYVYTGCFLAEVCNLEKVKIRTFLAHDVPRSRRFV